MNIEELHEKLKQEIKAYLKSGQIKPTTVDLVWKFCVGLTKRNASSEAMDDLRRDTAISAVTYCLFDVLGHTRQASQLAPLLPSDFKLDDKLIKGLMNLPADKLVNYLYAKLYPTANRVRAMRIHAANQDSVALGKINVDALLLRCKAELSERDLTIMRAVAEGKTDTDIAKEFKVHSSTVGRWRKNVERYGRGKVINCPKNGFRRMKGFSDTSSLDVPVALH